MSTRMVEPLTDVDYEILNRIYIEGSSIQQLTEVLSLSSKYIPSLLSRESVQPLIKEVIRMNEEELLGLEIKATSVLRAHLVSDSPEIQQKAIDKIYKRNGAYKQSVDVTVTAEDVIKKYMDGP